MFNKKKELWGHNVTLLLIHKFKLMQTKKNVKDKTKITILFIQIYNECQKKY